MDLPSRFTAPAHRKIQSVHGTPDPGLPRKTVSTDVFCL
jgi:hypothetical protein